MASMILVLGVDLVGKGTRKQAHQQIIPLFMVWLREFWLIYVQEKWQNSRSASIIGFNYLNHKVRLVR